MIYNKTNLVLFSILIFCISFYLYDRTSSRTFLKLSPFQYSTNKSQSQPQPHPDQNPMALRSVIYYVNWAIYARNHLPQDLPAEQFTHVLYSFANVRDTGEVYLTDLWSDTDKHFDGDSWNDVGTNLYGCLKQLFLLKKRHRHFKVLLSIGGWTYSSNFAGPASTQEGRLKFAESAMELLENMGFDGIDIDWEYPRDEGEARNYVELLRLCREKLDAAAARRSNARFYLTAAVPAGAQNYEKLKVSEMARYLDFWNLMAYDYAGSWDQTSGHQANLYPDAADQRCTPFNTADAVKYYTSHGVSPDRLVLGMPLYGRDFSNTDGPGKPYSGNGQGSWERGVWDYKALPGNARECYNEKIGASWSYDDALRTMVSYDTADVARQKANYVRSQGLGGGMWWESSGDKPRGGGSLVEAFLQGYGGHEQVLERSENCLEYPHSKYDNVRNGMST